LADEFVLFQLADRLVAADAKPVWDLAVSQKFAGPVGHTLPDQREARDGDKHCLGFERPSNPKCGEALAGSARHNETAADGLVVDEMLPCRSDRPLLMAPGRSRLGLDGFAFEVRDNRAPIARPPAV